VLWEDKHFITGTDIVKYVSWRFKLEGEPIFDQKKFEEGIFSDLRNLKPGHGAVLEEPRSKFLDFLFKLNCIRTHKKQKVFFWNSVPHEKLFQEALRREKKREINPIVETLLTLAAPHSPSPSNSDQATTGSKRKRMVETNHNDEEDEGSDLSERDEAQSRKKRSPVLSISDLINHPSPASSQLPYQTPKSLKVHYPFTKHLNVLTPPASESDPCSPQAFSRLHDDDAAASPSSDSHPTSPSSLHFLENQYSSDREEDITIETAEEESEQLSSTRKRKNLKSSSPSERNLRCHYFNCERLFRKKEHLDRHLATHKN